MPIFDLESDGLELEDVTKIHVISYSSGSEDEVTSLTDYEDMREFILNAKTLIGHNIVLYDLPVVKKILGVEPSPDCKIYDTLPLAWYLDHDRLKHGLEGYGEKYGVAKPEVTDWKEQHVSVYVNRCEEDVKINSLLWEDLTKRLVFLYKDKKEADRLLQYLTFKMKCMQYQAEAGWKLDKELCLSSIKKLEELEAEKRQELVQVMPERKLYRKMSPPSQLVKKDGTFTVQAEKWFAELDKLGLDRDFDGDIQVLKGTEPANPGSSDQVKEWLFSLGWEPCTFDYKRNEDGTERAIPQVRDDGELTESVLRLAETEPSVQVLEGYTVITHRLGIFRSFLEAERNGYVRAEIAGLTNTLRFKHKKPLVNLPGVDKPWGKEIRGCLICEDDEELCGADMVSLESTTKRHYMFPYDPEYVEEMSQPGFDEHLDLAKFADKVSGEDVELYVLHKDEEDLGDNLRKVIESVAKVRKKFKPVNYASVYGVGKVKLSRSTGMPEGECAELIKAYWKRNWSVKKVAESMRVRKIGGQMWLYNPVSGFWISLRYEKDIFSSLNQSTGVFCFDTWLAYCWAKGIKGIGQFHDEVITRFKKGMRDVTYAAMKDAIHRVNERLALNVPLDVDPKFGSRYSEIH